MDREKLQITRVSNVFVKCFLLFFLFPFTGFSTHIVGGAITYVHNGGSSYTITLKLYRDCDGFNGPSSLTIAVRGYNGATFSPSRDITIGTYTSSFIPSNLDTCADPPNPMPCVEERVFSTTVNNLPPNPGGYHLYFQTIARNWSLTNLNAVNNTVGETFYAYIPGYSVGWYENFSLANGTTTDGGSTAWTRTLGAPVPNYAQVNGNVFEFSGNDNASATWTSQVINISALSSGVNLSVDVAENSGLETNDSIILFYSLDGGPLTQFTTNGFFADNFGNAVASENNLIGNTVQIFAFVHYDGNSSGEIYRIDNVFVSQNNFQTNSNAEYNLFPPLFLCVGQPFVFDHSASDIDGDSLVYIFYTPYDGHDGSSPANPVSPTYSNNFASFTPVNFLGGFSYTNPLGGTPLNLNSSTGMLTGTPPMIGQFVVGIMVKEFRNGICIDSTLRDFQFNVVNCPPPATAVLPDTISACSGLTVTFSNQGNPSSNNWWDFGDPGVTNDTSVLAVANYTYPVEGFYDISLITNKGTFCADTDSAVVLVCWVDGGFVADTAGCAGDLYDFNDTSVVSSNDSIVSSFWDFGDGNTSTALDTFYSYLSDGTYTVTHIVTTSQGCTDTVVNTIVVDPGPVFVIDMTGNSDSVWTSPSVVRDCRVCGSEAPDVCITFILTLDSGTQAISFDIPTGAIPPGSLYYQLFCGDSNKVGDTICFDDPGPHHITFCKPGNNPNTYSISAITYPDVSPPITVSEGCLDTISANGYLESSLTWTSVSPGAQGDYNSYLSCLSGCDTVVVTGQPGYPPSVDYMACGLPIGGGSCSQFVICDTTTVYFVSTLAVDIVPQNPTICFGGANTNISANTSGGAQPYSYLWSTGSTTQSISIGVGTYYVTVSDTTNCQAVNDSVTVTSFSSNITANAGADQVICAASPAVSLNGTVTGVSTGAWSGGSGTYNPDNDSLNTTYTPTAAEITGGAIQLYLTTTNNGTCPLDEDTISISFNAVPTTSNAGPDQVICGVTSATITANTPVVGTGVWSFVSGSATITNPNSPTTTVSGMVAGSTYVLRWTISNGVCPPSTDDITISVDLLPTTANAGADQILCNSSNTTLAGNTPAVGTGNWTLVSGTGTITTPSSSVSTLTGLVPFDTLIVRWTISQGNCFSTDSVQILTDNFSAVTASVSKVSCNGRNDGTASLSPVDGISPYTYQWDSAAGFQSNSLATGLMAGIYSVTITDAFNCTVVQSVTITEPDSLLASVSSTNVICFGDSNGTATVSPAGGTSPYSFLWSDGQTDSTATGLFAGNYSVTVSDNNTCFFISSINLQQPDSALNVNVEGVGAQCYPETEDSCSITVTGGVPPYTFISVSDTTIPTQTFTTNCGITYSSGGGDITFLVQDSVGCTTPYQCPSGPTPTQMFINVSASNVSCKNGNDGSASASATGGESPYSFSWGSASINNLSAGIYGLTVTDANGCQSPAANVTITEPPLLNIFVTPSPAACKNTNSGSAGVFATGGTGPYSFFWSNGLGTGPTKTGLFAGNYSVTVVDAKNCSTTTSFNISEPPLLTVSVSSTPVLCKGGNSGTASAAASGGTLSYSFNWSNGQSGATINNISAGTYSVTVTDGNGCTETTSVTVTEPALALAVSSSFTNALCNGACNGTLSANASGGNGGFTYAWSGGLGSGATKSNVCAGTYTVTATDSKGCVDSSTVTVSEPALLVSSAVATNTLCKDSCNGSLSASATGGIASYSYLWSGGLGSGPSKVDVCTGSYSVTVTDSNGCTDTTSAAITEPALLIATIASTNVNCFGGNDGTASGSGTGGTQPYDFIWSDAQPDSIASGLIAGLYFVTMTDANGCSDTESVEIMQPLLPLSAITSFLNVKCFGGNDGSATVTPNGGTSPYSYLWDANAGSQNTASATGLFAGIYFVTATDSNGCTIGLNINVGQPDSALSASAIMDSISCKGGNDGLATVSATGGTAPYAFLWSNNANSPQISNLSAQNYFVTVTDTNNCTFITSIFVEEPATLLSPDTSSTLVICNGGSDGTASVSPSGGVPPYTYLWDVNANSQTSSTATGLSADTYWVTVTDNNNCIVTAFVAVDQPFSPLSITYITDSVNCNGGIDGSATVNPSGGTSPYTFEWNDPGAQTGSTATGLSAGNYLVTVTDYTGNCKVGNILTISEPDSLLLNSNFSNVSCFGGNDGSASVNPSGGTYPYTYLWNTGQDTTQISNLPSQNYSVTVTDYNGCKDSINFFIDQPSAPLSINSLSSFNVKCNGGNDGEAEVFVSGGTSPYSFLWNDSSQTITSGITGLYAGTYSVTITDTNNCIIDSTITITQPYPGLTVLISATDVSCFGGDDGTATITPAGGTSPYFYLWDNNAGSQTDSTATGLSSGTFSVTVTDNNGCVLVDSNTVFVGQPATYILVTTSQNNLKCFGDSDGTATLSVSGGTPPYYYLWDVNAGLQSDSTATSLSSGIYYATVTDENDCSVDSILFSITEPPPLMLTYSFTDVICKGDSDGAATITPSGGTSPYFYQWDVAANSQTDSTATGLALGTYSAIVTDENGCINDSALIVISEPSDSLFLATSFTAVICYGDSNGSATVSPSGGWPPYIYQWDNISGSQSDSTATGLKAGTFLVTVSDSKGCVDSSATVTVTQPLQLIASATQNDTICPDSAAVISVSGIGGTGTYTYNWDGVDTTQSQTVNPDSNSFYSVVITDANNCISAADTAFVFVRNYYPDQLVFSCGTALNCTLCPGSLTQISATYFEEYPPYSYIWLELGQGLGPFTVSPDSTTQYILRVSDQCGSFQDTLTVVVDSFPVIDVLAVTPGCEPFEITFENLVQNPPGSFYRWDFGDGSTMNDTNSVPTHEYLDEGTYNVSLIVTTPSFCSDTATAAATVVVYPQPEPECEGSPLTATLRNPVINFQTGTYSSWVWDFGDGSSDTTQNPVHNYKDSGDYYVTVLVKNQYNCENTCEIRIRINPEYPIGIPNAFTPDPNGPNGGVYSFDDFTNNVFFPVTRYVTEFRMEIFNRWGELLFVSEDVNVGWDGYYKGELCQQDVYAWKIYIKWWDGNVFNEVGDLTLLR